MENIRQIWEKTTNKLEKIYERREAENISYLLLEDTFEIRKADILVGEKKTFDKRLWTQCLERLLQHEPTQYVTGYANFYGRKFKIQEGALIPRPETEELCKLIIEQNSVKNPTIMDVGVGSGCIAITLSLELASGKVFGIDHTEEALKIAKMNNELFDAGVYLQKKNILKENIDIKNVDILVSNPPYIPISDKNKMSKNILKYEPKSALFVSNQDPLVFYNVIAAKGFDILKKGGKIYVEIHEKFGKQIKKMLEIKGYSDITIYPDMQGKDRMISGRVATH